MPTHKPRITITLEPHTYIVLGRLSEAHGVSMSSIVGDLLNMGMPSMERVVVLMEQARMADAEAKEGMRAAIDRAEAVFLPILAQAVDQADLFIADAAKSNAKATRPPAGRGSGTAEGVAAVLTPGLVTRGSGRLKAPPSRPAKGGQHGKV